MADNQRVCCLQNVLRNTDVAQLLLVSRTFVLDCWPAEDFALKNGRLVSTKARQRLGSSHGSQMPHLTQLRVSISLGCSAGKANKKSTRSLLHGALVRIAATGLLAQIAFGCQNGKGRRVLALQVCKLLVRAPLALILQHACPCLSLQTCILVL